MSSPMNNPAGVTGDFHGGCRECIAGYSQAVRSMTGFRCADHGVMAYDSEQAIKAAITREAQSWAQSAACDHDLLDAMKKEINRLKGVLLEIRQDANANDTVRRCVDNALSMDRARRSAPLPTPTGDASDYLWSDEEEAQRRALGESNEYRCTKCFGVVHPKRGECCPWCSASF